MIKKCFYLAVLMVFLLSVTMLSAQQFNSNKIGNHNGYTFEYWKDSGNGTLTLGSGATFKVNWNNIHNLLGRVGKRPGSRNQSVSYGVDYKPRGNSFMCVYGWTTNPLVEYYIVDSWGSWRPPGGKGHMGTVTSDGATYDIYRTQRVNKPSIRGNTTFYQYWSVRKSKRSSGTITCANHFKAWASKGMKMGSLYEVSFCIEGYKSSGSANVHKLSFGTSSGGNKYSKPKAPPKKKSPVKTEKKTTKKTKTKTTKSKKNNNGNSSNYNDSNQAVLKQRMEVEKLREAQQAKAKKEREEREKKIKEEALMKQNKK